MQLSTLPIAVAALLLAGKTTALDCKDGLKYCGSTLYNMDSGWDWVTVRAAVVGDWPAQKSEEAIKNQLFECQVNGWFSHKLKYIKTCNKGCVDAGAGKSDYCK